MEQYVDGYVLPLPSNKIDEYRRLCDVVGRVWMDHGALQYWECIGDDVQPGKLTSFPQAVQLKEDETVVFSWIVYRSREHRDEVNALVMADPRMTALMAPGAMPFDTRRMFWGGFRTLVTF